MILIAKYNKRGFAYSDVCMKQYSTVAMHDLHGITRNAREMRESCAYYPGKPAEMIAHETSKSDAFTKMTLPRTSIRHVIPARTRERTSDVVHTEDHHPLL